MKPEKFDYERLVERIFVNRANIEEELAKNPSWMAYYSAQAATWQQIVDIKKAQIKDRKGEISKELRQDNAKVAAHIIEAEQDTDETIRKLVSELGEAQKQATLFTDAHYNLDKKQFSLQSLNKRNDREEVLSRAQSYQGKMQEILDAQR